ncbi:MAG: helix-turn-helix transcriptional regulator [Defluviitaleaceae bacterium]|nr:helix-turn-helix transcriptional regulator [Defluviitaleaceae bacterium]
MEELTGIDQSCYSKLELGKRNLSFEQCKRLALTLGTSMDYLAELTDNPAPYDRKK